MPGMWTRPDASWLAGADPPPAATEPTVAVDRERDVGIRVVGGVLIAAGLLPLVGGIVMTAGSSGGGIGLTFAILAAFALPFLLGGLWLLFRLRGIVIDRRTGVVVRWVRWRGWVRRRELPKGTFERVEVFRRRVRPNRRTLPDYWLYHAELVGSRRRLLLFRGRDQDEVRRAATTAAEALGLPQL